MTHPEQLRQEIKDILDTVCECCSSEDQLNKILALIDKARKEAVEEARTNAESALVEHGADVISRFCDHQPPNVVFETKDTLEKYFPTPNDQGL